MNIVIRIASPDDAAALSGIYRPYVEGETVTLEYIAPAAEEFAGRIRDTLAEFPYLVCEADGVPVGYAYAHRYKQRFGYRYCAELSIYLDKRYHRCGIGGRLYRALIELLSRMGYKNLYATVTDPNPASVGLHENFGFREVGRERLAGYKFGTWHDVMLLQRLIDSHEETKDETKWNDRPLRFDELDKRTVDEILTNASSK